MCRSRSQYPGGNCPCSRVDLLRRLPLVSCHFVAPFKRLIPFCGSPYLLITKKLLILSWWCFTNFIISSKNIRKMDKSLKQPRYRLAVTVILPISGMNCDKCLIFAMMATWKVKLKSGISSAGLCVVVKGDQRQLLSCGKTIKVSRPHPPAAMFLKIKNGTFKTPSSLRGRNTNEIQAAN